MLQVDARPHSATGESVTSPAPEGADFDAFYQASGPRLVRQLHALTGDLTEAQDVVQEAFVRAWQRWSKVRELDAPEAWVRHVAKRLAISRFRRAMVGAGLVRRHGPPPDEPDLSPDRVAIVEALRRLPAEQREAIVLFHLGDLSVAEVAKEMKCPEGTVKARLSRGRAALAGLLSEQEREVPSA